MYRIPLAMVTLLMLAGASCRVARGEDVAASTVILKFVVHVNFSDGARQVGGLRNIKNILREVGDRGAVVEVVCHGDGIGLAHRGRSECGEQVASLSKRGVRFVACRNTMRQR